MASQPWHPEPPLTERLAEEPFRFEFYQAVKLLELLAARSRHGLRSLAEGHTPSHEALRIKSRSTFAFPASSVHDLELPPALCELPALLQSLPGALSAFISQQSIPATGFPEATTSTPRASAEPHLWPLRRLVKLLETGVHPDHHTRGDVWHEWQAALRGARRALLHALLEGRDASGRSGAEQTAPQDGRTLRAALRRLEKLLASPDVPVLTINFLSLAGAMGPLPQPYSELVLAQAARGDTAAIDFLDIFHHRLASLMFRVRKHFTIGLATQPPGQDQLARRLSAFVGAPGGRSPAPTALPLSRLLSYAGLVAWQPHSATILERCLSDYFALPVSVVPATGGWLVLEPEQQSRLGRTGTNRELGDSAVLGTRVWDQQGSFDLHLGPLTSRQFEDFLPTGTAYAPLCALTRFLVGPELEFQIELELGPGEPSALCLGAARRPRLGWSAWLGGDTSRSKDAAPRRVRLRGRLPGSPLAVPRPRGGAGVPAGQVGGRTGEARPRPRPPTATRLMSGQPGV